jgi:hypothetical protein
LPEKSEKRISLDTVRNMGRGHPRPGRREVIRRKSPE